MECCDVVTVCLTDLMLRRKKERDMNSVTLGNRNRSFLRRT